MTKNIDTVNSLPSQNDDHPLFTPTLEADFNINDQFSADSQEFQQKVNEIKYEMDLRATNLGYGAGVALEKLMNYGSQVIEEIHESFFGKDHSFFVKSEDDKSKSSALSNEKMSRILQKKVEAIYNENEGRLDDLSMIDYAISMNPKGQWLHYDRAVYHRQNKNYTAAIEDFTSEIENDNKSESKDRSYFDRGRIHLQLKDYANALSDFKKAEITNNNAFISNEDVSEVTRVLKSEGGQLFNDKEYQEALNLQDYAISISSIRGNPVEKWLYFDRGFSRFRTGDYKGAIDDFTSELDNNISEDADIKYRANDAMEIIYYSLKDNKKYASYFSETKNKYLIKLAEESHASLVEEEPPAKITFLKTLVGLLQTGLKVASSLLITAHGVIAIANVYKIIQPRENQQLEPEEQQEPYPFKTEADAEADVRSFAGGCFGSIRDDSNLRIIATEDLDKFSNFVRSRNDDDAKELSKDFKLSQNNDKIIQDDLKYFADMLISPKVTKNNTHTDDINYPRNFVYEKIVIINDGGHPHNPINSEKLEWALGIFEDEIITKQIPQLHKMIERERDEAEERTNKSDKPEIPNSSVLDPKSPQLETFQSELILG